MSSKVLLDGVVISDPRSLEAAIDEALDRVDAQFARAVAQGMPWQGRVLQIDDASQTRLASAVLGAQLGLLPQGIAWRMADNGFLHLTAAGLIAMAGAAMGHTLALRQCMWAARDAARAAQDRDEADAIAF